ncbi:MAG: tyrosine-type recombinase/integrase, partial [Halobacteriota archaeon]
FLFFSAIVKNITDYLEKEQVDQVLQAAQRCSARDYLMLRVLWRTGVRVNELLTITPRDVEPNNSVINVTKAKGGKQRRVHLDAETIKMLAEYVSAQQLSDDRPIFGQTATGAKHRQALWFCHRKRRPPPYLPTLICDSLCAKRLGYPAAAAGARAFKFERDGGVSAVQRSRYQGIVR